MKPSPWHGISTPTKFKTDQHLVHVQHCAFGINHLEDGYRHLTNTHAEIGDASQSKSCSPVCTVWSSIVFLRFLKKKRSHVRPTQCTATGPQDRMSAQRTVRRQSKGWCLDFEFLCTPGNQPISFYLFDTTVNSASWQQPQLVLRRCVHFVALKVILMWAHTCDECRVDLVVTLGFKFFLLTVSLWNKSRHSLPRAKACCAKSDVGDKVFHEI